MKKALTTFILSLAVLFAFAQNQPAAYFIDKISTTSNYSRIDTNSKGQVILVSGYKSSNVKLNSNQEFERLYIGTPFFDNGWYNGKVVLKGGEPVEGLMAYDLVKNVVYYSKNKEADAVELRPNDFNLNGKKFSKYEGEYSGAGNYYYETLAFEEPMLLKQYVCKYTSNKTDVDHGYGSKQSSLYEGEYSKDIKYYLAMDGKLTLVKNKRSFFKALGKIAAKAEAYAKENKLNMNKQEDALALAEYLARLE